MVSTGTRRNEREENKQAEACSSSWSSTGDKYLNEVDLLEAIIASRLLDVEDGDDVFVVEIAQQLHLSQGSQTEHGVVEGGDLLDGNLLS
jgi:hypothetical protein